MLADLIAQSQAAGRETTLQFLGSALRRRLGAKWYEEFAAGGLKAALAARPGWQLTETRPGWQLTETRPGVNVLRHRDR